MPLATTQQHVNGTGMFLLEDFLSQFTVSYFAELSCIKESPDASSSGIRNNFCGSVTLGNSYSNPMSSSYEKFGSIGLARLPSGPMNYLL